MYRNICQKIKVRIISNRYINTIHIEYINTYRYNGQYIQNLIGINLYYPIINIRKKLNV